MPRAFLAASLQGLYNDTAIVSAYPFSVAGWFKLLDNAAIHYLFSLSALASNLTYWVVAVPAGTTILRLSTRNTTLLSIDATGVIALARWQHFAGVWVSATERYIWLNGGYRAGSAAETSVTYSGVATTSLGYQRRLNPTGYMNGSLDSVAAWNVALTNDEVLRLSEGVSPLRVRQANVVDFWPLEGRFATEPSFCPGGGHELTLLNAPVIDVVRPQLARPRRYMAA